LKQNRFILSITKGDFGEDNDGPPAPKKLLDNILKVMFEFLFLSRAEKKALKIKKENEKKEKL